MLRRSVAWSLRTRFASKISDQLRWIVDRENFGLYHQAGGICWLPHTIGTVYKVEVESPSHNLIYAYSG